MYLFYSFLLSLAAFALLPYFVWQAVFKRKYLNNLSERLGHLPTSWCVAGRPTLWLHAVSVGETLAALPLLEALRARFPGHRLILSTTTATGQQVARARAKSVDGVCYFPFDWRFAVRRALRTLQPQAVILMESELWPNFLAECEAQRIPVIVANGRISDRSFHRARRLRWLLKPLYGKVTRFLMQSELDAERALALGAAPACVQTSGNLKYDLKPPAHSAALLQELETAFQLTSAPLIVAGSTTESAAGNEEVLLVQAFAALRQRPGCAEVRLLLAPRHPERFNAVAALLSQTSWKIARRSDRAADCAADIILLDSIGELAALYQFADVVFVGGSLVPKGGHNILEPALYGKPIVVGPHMENFRDITKEFLQRDAVVQLSQAEPAALVAALADTCARLLTDRVSAQTLGQNAAAAVAAKRGATERTVEAVASLLS